MKDGLILNFEISVKDNILKFYDEEKKGVYENTH